MRHFPDNRTLVIIVLGWALLSASDASAPDDDILTARRHVEYLAAIEPARNHRNLQSLEKAVKYIKIS